ncbi:hypothetical protein PYCCODRAFT_1205606 [Trametes coccinea BRFM310]|uniref:Uncharacterized protein n=1 Tax=Trametes coccinea (strain BRFM310) TaxID=1353009 RepID=A0A1Y2I8F6_TRAC3|nr:hypothetical protein PYCCODRAFT_1205606 [Trametes coccinea BRFM310]
MDVRSARPIYGSGQHGLSIRTPNRGISRPRPPREPVQPERRAPPQDAVRRVARTLASLSGPSVIVGAFRTNPRAARDVAASLRARLTDRPTDRPMRTASTRASLVGFSKISLKAVSSFLQGLTGASSFSLHTPILHTSFLIRTRLSHLL